MKLCYDVPLVPRGENVLVHGDSLNHAENRLENFWQWNHNPDDAKWSFTARSGWLRLTASPAVGLMDAKNTLSQRTCGPQCEFTVELDAAGLAAGGRAGLAALQWDCALVGVEAQADGSYRLFTAKRDVIDRTTPPTPQADVFTAPLSGARVFLKAAFDFRDVEGHARHRAVLLRRGRRLLASGRGAAKSSTLTCAISSARARRSTATARVLRTSAILRRERFKIRPGLARRRKMVYDGNRIFLEMETRLQERKDSVWIRGLVC